MTYDELDKLQNKPDYLTVIMDNPSLTCRMKNGRNPIRIVIDTNLSTDKNAKVYNNTFEGAFIKGDSYGGYFNNRGTGTYEIKYNKFVNVDSGSLLSTDTTTTHIFDCNLYLVDDVASTTSLATGLTGTTADTTVCESEQQLAELWATYKAQ